MNPATDIARLDKNLSTLRESWMDAKPESKQKWMNRINEALDQRFTLMVLRDSAIVTVSAVNNPT